MPRKKKTAEAPTPSAGENPTVKIGSRVRCTDDGVTGRIVWGNAVSVKIWWDDGEQVTWRRDSLADRPIAIVDADDGGDQPAAPPPPATGAKRAGTSKPRPAKPETTPTAATPSSIEEVAPVAESTGNQTAAARANETVPRSVKSKRPATGAVAKKLSALDAAAQVLAECGGSLNCQEMIAAMAAKGYWTSPGGKTPAATLYSAILRELATKGTNARFVKTQRGHFASNDTV
jgi:HB1, ASXL, restriction endonuclease HTH domain